ncbi:DUF6543 domain-containing protein, partial [Paenibacillus polymyxa]|uniref:dermonecrotic toxin domain-containing protein n=1 Tax=Paenibacillus polymyxa TaxID=1406 RepID=UPI00307D4B98
MDVGGKYQRHLQTAFTSVRSDRRSVKAHLADLWRYEFEVAVQVARLKSALEENICRALLLVARGTPGTELSVHTLSLFGRALVGPLLFEVISGPHRGQVFSYLPNAPDKPLKQHHTWAEFYTYLG